MGCFFGLRPEPRRQNGKCLEVYCDSALLLNLRWLSRLTVQLHRAWFIFIGLPSAEHNRNRLLFEVQEYETPMTLPPVRLRKVLQNLSCVLCLEQRNLKPFPWTRNEDCFLVDAREHEPLLLNVETQDAQVSIEGLPDKLTVIDLV